MSGSSLRVMLRCPALLFIRSSLLRYKCWSAARCATTERVRAGHPVTGVLKLADLIRAAGRQVVRINLASRRSAAGPLAAFNRNGHQVLAERLVGLVPGLYAERAAHAEMRVASAYRAVLGS